MDEVAKTLITVGGLMLLGLAADSVGRRTRLPRVTLLMLMGVMVGPSGLDLLPASREVWFPVAADIALVMIGLLLGAEFNKKHLAGQFGRLIGLSLAQAIVTAAVVGLALVATGVDFGLAVLMAGIATATAPAATVAVTKETRSRGPLTDTLLRVVAIDDLFALILFSLLAAFVGIVINDGPSGELVLRAAIEIGGAVGLGIAVGIPAAFLTGRIQPGEATLLEALGLVLLAVGLANWLHLSPLLFAVVIGITITNLARHHERPFTQIGHIDWPFLVVFFLVAGASLHLDALRSIGLLGAGYIVLRTVGKLLGGYVGGKLFGYPESTSRWLGVALLPHAGVALGLALIAGAQFPELGEEVLSVTVVATVIFELFGPVATKLALARAGEVPEV